MRITQDCVDQLGIGHMLLVTSIHHVPGSFQGSEAQEDFLLNCPSLTLYNTWGKKIECAGCEVWKIQVKERKVNSWGKRKCQSGNLPPIFRSFRRHDRTWEVGQWKEKSPKAPEILRWLDPRCNCESKLRSWVTVQTTDVRETLSQESDLSFQGFIYYVPTHNNFITTLWGRNYYYHPPHLTLEETRRRKVKQLAKVTQLFQQELGFKLSWLPKVLFPTLYLYFPRMTAAASGSHGQHRSNQRHFCEKGEGWTVT